jgi:hypothetical protein
MNKVLMATGRLSLIWKTKETTMKLATIALASAFALSNTFALAKTVPHRPGVRTYDLHRGMGSSGFLHPSYGNTDGATTVSAGGLMWNGRSASEWGGG